MRKLKQGRRDGRSQVSLWTGLQGVSPTDHCCPALASRKTGTRASPGDLGTSGEDLSLVVEHKLFEEPEKKSLVGPVVSGDRVMWTSKRRQTTSLDFPAFLG